MWLVLRWLSWVANDNDDDDDGGGTKLVATAGSLQSSSLQSWHGDHFKETGGPCWLRWAFYNVRRCQLSRHWPSTRTKKEQNQKNGLATTMQLPPGRGREMGGDIAKRSTRKAGGKWPKLALSKSDNNHAWVLTLTLILTPALAFAHTIMLHLQRVLVSGRMLGICGTPSFSATADGQRRCCWTCLRSFLLVCASGSPARQVC